MVRKKQFGPFTTARLATIFIVFVLAVACVSILIKIAVLFSQRSFDTAHQFVLAVHEDNATAHVISFAPDAKTVAVVTLTHVKTTDSIKKILEIPIDAEMTDPHQYPGNVGSLMSDFAWHFQDFQPKHMNTIDAYMLYWFARNIPANQTNTLTIDTTSQQQMNHLIASIFQDQTLYQENAAVAVVNATNITGLGNRVARLLTNVGANVISVTSDQMQNPSQITYKGRQTYTIERISRILHIPASTKNIQSIADITITIGNDAKDRLDN